MNEYLHDQNNHTAAGDPGAGPEVIYLERDRGMVGSARRARETVRAKGREWVADAVDAPLPRSIQGRVPSAWETPCGRVAVGVGAVLVLLGWALILLWVIG
ncbi:hypothetical protein [Micrococcus sp.]|uniref:hypothetical protein n=1 Tax=Micrococcus sp. TaxID=1271 RepID=UPI0026DB8718|nr:hypothetical protein [Micrococcus sp.]MDO4240677.1 hypothetical protein [Micrococcus sp.]